MFAVARGHMSRFGGDPHTPCARMRGHRLCPEVERDQRVAGVQFKPLASHRRPDDLE